ncbi:short-chain dehydrogenase, partial [Clostridioides difficile]|nr:short-chain dehydrogenase [Clostridioides difficile]
MVLPASDPISHALVVIGLSEASVGHRRYVKPGEINVTGTQHFARNGRGIQFLLVSKNSVSSRVSTAIARAAMQPYPSPSLLRAKFD